MSANKVTVVYTGSLPDVVFEGGYAVSGVPVEVSAELAGRLCQQKHWNIYEKPAPAPKKKAAAKSAGKDKED